MERDRAAGLLVDEAGVPFKCASQTLWDFAERLPVIRVLQAEDHEIMEGQEIKHEGLQVRLGSGEPGIRFAWRVFERPAWVMVKDEITLEMMTLGGTHRYSLFLRAGTSAPKAYQNHWPCPGQGQGVEISKPHSGSLRSRHVSRMSSKLKSNYGAFKNSRWSGDWFDQDRDGCGGD